MEIMAAYIKTLKDPSKTNIIYPKTKASAVFMDDNSSLESSVSPLKIKCLTFSNIPVAVASWASDTTYSNFPYAASIALSGVTTDYIPTVNFDNTEAVGGNFSPIASTGSGTVIIYAALS